MCVIAGFVDNCIIVKIPVGVNRRKTLYEATRRCWRADLNRARRAEYVLGTVDGVKVECVIKIKSCDYVRDAFCDKEEAVCRADFGVDTALCKTRRRIAFEGDEMKDDKKYLNRSLPKGYMPKQNPVRYTYN